ncbi:tetratricopeptide repeat protein [Streptomyces gamaensis]|uniref:non-specific serine/threonine protein kinase n=1 Tax=Streptomyces gamaensis TaxID=1763542 RepID=A0ABW0Z0Y2_9ACTN
MTPPRSAPPGPDRPEHPCPRRGCAGRIVAGTGFCSDCGRRPPRPPGSEREPRTLRTVRDPLFTVGPPGPGPLDLPVVGAPSPEELVVRDPRAVLGGKTCGWRGCTAVVGVPYAGQPALTRGYCERCGHPFDFTPRLAPGERVGGGQYTVVGCLAHGGLGWIYLARDTRLFDRYVALKGLIHTGDSAALQRAGEERRYLTSVDHPGIVRVFNHVAHPDWGTAESDGRTSYTVMEYVDGMSLAQVRDRIRRGDGPFGEERVIEHVLAYGCAVLQALDHLHRKKLVHCDIKPHNVMHHGDRVKLIDLGGVHRLGADGPVLGTPGYVAPEVSALGARGLSVRSDVYGLGVTLRQLAAAARSRPPGLGRESCKHVLARATARDPYARYPSADAMAQQLHGVLKEIHSVRTGIEHPEPSALFGPGGGLLDASLGRPPDLECWLADGGRRLGADEERPPLAPGLPAPATVPALLPAPLPHPADPAAALLLRPSPEGLRRLVAQLDAVGLDRSVELRLRQCRAHLELGELAEAQARLREARRARRLEIARHTVQLKAAGRSVIRLARHDWRIDWHRGLLLLATGDTAAAQGEFHRVYRALPGESAPKLALGYCAEHRGEAAAAERYYQAVWRRDRAQAGAAFGLARLRLAAGDRGGAVDLLGEVPRADRYYDAARVACIRVLAGRLPGAGPPGRTDLEQARARLRSLRTDGETQSAYDWLAAEVYEATLAWCTGPKPRSEGSGRPAPEETEETVRWLLERTLRDLAQQVPTPYALGVLIDRANSVRPMTRT